MSAEHEAVVSQCWDEEIRPDLSLILGCGGHEAKRYLALPHNEQLLYQKYRFDVYVHYNNAQHTALPPQDMWRDGVLNFQSFEAQQWHGRMKHSK
jgi:hypothetical protein